MYRLISIFTLLTAPFLLFGQVVNSFPYYEDFESQAFCVQPCGGTCILVNSWQNDTINDDIDWAVDTNGTSSGGTGPSVDHNPGTPNGRYLYSESSFSCKNSSAYFISPYFDFSSLSIPIFEFWYHMYGEDMGFLHVDIAVGNGPWVMDIIPAWTDSIDLWQQQTIHLDAYAGMDSVRLRLRTVTGDGSESDMAIDDFSIYAPTSSDFGVFSIDSVPNTSCGITTESIYINIVNEGADTLFQNSAIPINYDDGVNFIQDTLIVSSDVFPFDTVTYPMVIDYSTEGNYNIAVWTSVHNDSVASNDTAYAQFMHIPTITNFPYEEDFESGKNGWIAYNDTNGTWAFGTPNKTVINSAASGMNAWVTGGLDSAEYNNFEHSWVESPCFDFSQLNGDEWIILDIWHEIEFTWDGVTLQYTEDNINWVTLGAFGDPYNWYNLDTINSRPGGSYAGWSGSHSNGSKGWVRALQPIPSTIMSSTSVKFRIILASDIVSTSDGFAFDNFSVRVPTLSDFGTLTMCPYDTLTLSAEAADIQSYIWNTGSTASSIDVTVSGAYSVTATDTSGIARIDTINVSVFPSHDINLGIDTASCGPILLDAGDGFSNYLWSDSTNTQTLLVTTSDTYRVIANDENGCENYDTIAVSVLPLPNIDLGADTNLCASPSIVLDAGNGFSDYQWSNGDTTQSISTGISGSYSVTITDSNGCSDSDEITVFGCVGINQNLNSTHIFYYPNPATNELTFTFKKGKNTTVEVYLLDLQGRVVYSESIQTDTKKINLDSYAKGAYLLHFKKGNETLLMDKLIIK